MIFFQKGVPFEKKVGNWRGGTLQPLGVVPGAQRLLMQPFLRSEPGKTVRTKRS